MTLPDHHPHALLTTAETAYANRRTEATGISALQMTQAGGAAVAAEIIARWPAQPIAILCGPGGNGGDGYGVARHLARAGWDVRLAAVQNTRCDADHARLWTGPIAPMTPAIVQDVGLIVDALFGTGLSHPLEAEVDQVLAAVGRAKIIAIDILSGVMADTGQSLGAVGAVLTVTFGRKKPCHLLQPGKVVVADIGTPARIFDQIAPKTHENHPDLWRNAWPQLDAAGHKYSRGHALIWGGYPMTGAARLAARAALGIGAGVVTLAVPEIALPV